MNMGNRYLEVIERETTELKPDMDPKEFRKRTTRILAAVKRLEKEFQTLITRGPFTPQAGTS
jgi:hypothetical protein